MRQHAAGVAHWRDRELIPERLAALAVIANEHRALLALLDRAAHVVQRGLIARARVQDARVAPDQLLGAVAGDREVRGVHVRDRVIRLPRVGDHDAVLRRRERALVDAQHALREAPRGDVLHERTEVEQPLRLVLLAHEPDVPCLRAA
jgi:hypothetical protein